MKQSRYSNEEKLKIIAEARSSGNISATAKRYSITDVCIHGWIRKFSKSKPEKDLHAELKKMKCSITLSLDGPAEINDLVRPGLNGQGVTTKILEGLKLALKSKEHLGSVGVQAVFGKHNAEVLLAYQFFCQLGV